MTQPDPFEQTDTRNDLQRKADLATALLLLANGFVEAVNNESTSTPRFRELAAELAAEVAEEVMLGMRPAHILRTTVASRFEYPEEAAMWGLEPEAYRDPRRLELTA